MGKNATTAGIGIDRDAAHLYICISGWQFKKDNFTGKQCYYFYPAPSSYFAAAMFLFLTKETLMNPILM